MKCFLVLVLVLFVQTTTTLRYANRYYDNNNNNNNNNNNDNDDDNSNNISSNNKRKHHKYDITTAHYTNKIPEPEVLSVPVVEVDMPQCPKGCACQYAHFMDLPISRWITHMQQRQQQPQQPQQQQQRQPQHPDVNRPTDYDEAEAVEATENLINENESAYEGDISFLTNPLIKQATCILQEDTDPGELVNALPHDLQALILLYTGIGKNKTVNSSILRPLNQLTTLEIRGPQDKGFHLLFDAPLNFLQYANFESITLLGSESYKRPKNPVHPKEAFDYKPNIELLGGGGGGGGEFLDNSPPSAELTRYDHKLLVQLQQQQEEEAEEELEIVPYEVYREEVKKARMPSFYGWNYLEVLRIHSCQLSDLSWEMFFGLEALQHLSLERNGIVAVPPFAFSGATQLKTLSLAHNRIHDFHYRDLAGLFELQVLDLSDNRLSKLTELSFPPLPKLQRVDFRSNPIRYIFPATFWVMNRTQQMYFGSDSTPLELWGNMPFKTLQHLRVLAIGNVSIGNLEQNIFKDLSSLEELKLRGEVRRLEFDAFAGLKELRELDMSGCQLREVSMDAFMGCKRLRLINLGRNNLSYIPPGLFDDQPLLEEIYLDGNQLLSLPAAFFQQRKLRLARLNDNPWQCSCDMSNWRAKVTNQERGPSTERCITDYISGKRIACRRVATYKFDHRYAPRCANFNGRSVFYVLRKQLKCGPARIDLASRQRHVPKQRIPHWRKLEERHEAPPETLPSKEQWAARGVADRMSWQIQGRDKFAQRPLRAEQNSLHYQLHRSAERKSPEVRRKEARIVTHEISNEI